MATVVITFFLFVQLYVFKMDADCIEKQRDQILSRREKRWSMNSQRLEEIVAELLKPISDVRRSFDTDLSALLEEYLTEAGLRALDAGEEASAADAVPPNYAELALLLQQSATIYGRKVDFLYQHVLDVSDSLHNSSQEPAAPAPDAPDAPDAAVARRRRREAPAAACWARVALQAAPGARREAAPARPPPTLPRMFTELEPRVITEADVPLLDYAGEPIGLLADFRVAWRLHRGLLVDELEDETSSEERALRPIPLVELQAAIEAAAPPLPLAPLEGPPSSPLRCSTPLPAPGAPEPDTAQHDAAEPDTPEPDTAVPSLPVPVKRERKRRSEIKIDDVIEGSMKIVISEELLRKLAEIQEFSIATRWIRKVVEKRKSHILSERRRLREEEPDPRAEFAGWSGAEAAEAAAAAKSRAGEPDSEDDGFFEQSSVASERSRAEEAGAEAAAWRGLVLQRAAAAEARGSLDVRALGGRVLAGLPRGPPVPFASVLRGAAESEADVSRLFLATLFLANAGNVEVLQGAPLSVNSFSLRLVSTDEQQLAAATAAEQFLR